MYTRERRMNSSIKKDLTTIARYKLENLMINKVLAKKIANTIV
ncbi:hypothetical protein [Ferruginibacter sp.]|nr:hypothetical protein [Ferruginibacter sp.]